ncbi:MAG: transpeptidase family protein [Deltaproteobacteria bacterium]|nr:transpeptidase family protein [Deltaproteobacteria bacterium]MCL5278113.1 transpeptidase family protein [Deltaproteobacteria bacterium]
MDAVKKIHEHQLVRLFIVYLCIISGFAVIVSKAFYLEVVRGRRYAELARRQYSREITLIPARGTILDRDGRILAQSVLVDSIYADPLLVTNKSRAAVVASRVLGLNADETLRKLSTDRQFVWIERLVDPDIARKLLRYHLKGIYSLKEYRRFYPNRDIAANVLGFVGVDSKGLSGIELSLDDYLQGTPFSAVVDVDGHNSPVYTGNSFNGTSMSGDNVVTTIDLNIQFILQTALKEAVTELGASKGVGIIMEPRTGEILAMVSVPDFNPNIYREYPLSVFKDIAVENTYEPGSIFKPFVISAALDGGAISADQEFFCEHGHYRVYNIVISDAEGRYGMLDAGDILKYSSNIGAAKIGEKLGPAALYGYLKRFGFGSPTGINLPGESPGILNPLDRWSGVSIDTIPFGQGVSATPIQLVTAMSAIANGGLLVMPQIIKEIRGSNGTVINFSPVIRRRVISRDTAKTMTGMLIGVVNDGTGLNARMDGYTVAGKTGTAQIPDPETGRYYKNRFVSSFLGFVPANDPSITMLVMIVDPKTNPYGGESAAPIFRDVAEKILPYLGVPSRLSIMATPSNEPSVSDMDQMQAAYVTQTGVVPDFRGKSIRTVLREAKSAGIDDLVIKGSGYAIRQSPEPHAKYSHGRVVVVFSDSVSDSGPGQPGRAPGTIKG